MIRYKMIARDVNSNPVQYRTWIVSNSPDFTGSYYTGIKSGTSPFEDVSAYFINDDGVIADFNLPIPASWNDNGLDVPIRKTLPLTFEDSQFAIIDGYAYMFGGKITNKIYRASTSNPTDWSDTGSTLPTALYGAALAIIGSTIYLFGGNDGYSSGSRSVDTIFTASTSNPLLWTNHGSLLPRKICYSSFGMYNGNIYLFGGYEAGPSNAILTSTTSSPLVWADSVSKIPQPTYGATIAQIGGYWKLFGGLNLTSSPTNTIWKASVSSATSWSLDGYMTYATAFSQFVSIGNDGYIIGPMAGSASTGYTQIIQCNLSSSNSWIDTLQVVFGDISHSQIAIIQDRVWLFGGSGNTSIFACNQDIKYNYYDTRVLNYVNATRVAPLVINNILNPYQAFCMPYWRTDYTL